MRHHSSLNIGKGDRVRLRGRSGTFVVDRVWGRMLNCTDNDGGHHETSTWAIVMLLPKQKIGHPGAYTSG
jgi:hypothetical protein